MLAALRRHPVSMVAHFDHCLVLTYALPAEVLQSVVPPGLQVETLPEDPRIGFAAVAMVQTRRLRPRSWPAVLGRDFFLVGYRVFVRFTTPQGKSLRGLRILRSDADRAEMVLFGNVLTHYHYRLAQVNFQEEADRLSIEVATPRREADLKVAADLRTEASLPAGSPFAYGGSPSRPQTSAEPSCHARSPRSQHAFGCGPNDGSRYRAEQAARRFAGPLPYTFDYEPESHAVIAIRGVRRNWAPRMVDVQVDECTFFQHPPFDQATPRLACAFYVRDIAYCWERGIRYPLAEDLS
jgi:hypothetical protein